MYTVKTLQADGQYTSKFIAIFSEKLEDLAKQARLGIRI